ncbi:hypothetical protein [Streptomyces sp. NPDC001292]|uniref:hypothetical protein n=1 Tax=Streptomyces sp. NPDC001292 TaxID=3364558 RepID=UPI0036B3A1CF
MKFGKSGEGVLSSLLRRAAGITAALITGVFSLSVAEAPAAQASAQEVVAFQNQATLMCLDGYGGST